MWNLAPCPCSSATIGRGEMLIQRPIKEGEAQMEHSEQQLWHDAAVDLRTKLFRFAGRNRFNADFDDAFSFFFGESPEEAPDDYTQITLNRFTEWFIFDYRLDHGHRLVELFELEHVAEMNELMRQLLTHWQQSHLSLMEITAIGRETIAVEDLILGGEYTIVRPSATRTDSLQTQTLLIGRLLRVGNWYEIPAGATFLPKHLRSSIIGWLRGEYRRYHLVRNGTWADFLRENGFVFNDLLDNLSEVLDVENPVRICVRAVYLTVDYAACERKLLLQAENVEAVGPRGSRNSHLHVGYLPDAAGEFRFSRERLDVICPTWEDLDYAKKMVAQTLGKAVRHRVDVIERQKPDKRRAVLDPSSWAQPCSAPARVDAGSDAISDLTAAAAEADIVHAAKEKPQYVYDEFGEKRQVTQENVPLAKQGPTYLSLRQWRIAEIAAVVVGGMTEQQAHQDVVRWLWSDYCHLVNPRIKQEASWAAALHVVMGRIEGWRLTISDAARLYECNAQTVGKKVGLIWDALQLQQFDDRYCVEHPVDSLFKHLGTQMTPEHLGSSGDAERILPAAWGPQPAQSFAMYEKLILLRDLLDNYADHLDFLVGRAVAIFQKSLGQEVTDSFWHKCFTDWFHFDWAIPVRGGLTILEEAAASEELEDYRHDLQAWRHCHPNFYVIQDVAPPDAAYGGAVEVILAPLTGGGDPVTAVWPTSVASLQSGKYLFCRLVPVDGKLINAGCALLYNAEAGREIKERLEEEYALLGRWSGEHLSWESLSAKYADRLYGLAYRAAHGFPEED
ncbi:MAG: hypothetical protein ACOX44_00535 [Limnochordia bacterium]